MPTLAYALWYAYASLVNYARLLAEEAAAYRHIRHIANDTDTVWMMSAP